MSFFLANLFYIAVVAVFIGTLVFRYFLRRKQEGKPNWITAMKLKNRGDRGRRVSASTVKPDDERRLRLERLKSARLRYVGEEVKTGVITLEESGFDLGNDKFDELAERHLGELRSSNFSTKKFGKEIETAVKVLEQEVSEIGSGERKIPKEREESPGLKRINKLRPLVQRFVWKEVLDRPRADNLNVHWW